MIAGKPGDRRTLWFQSNHELIQAELVCNVNGDWYYARNGDILSPDAVFEDKEPARKNTRQLLRRIIDRYEQLLDNLEKA